MNSAQRHSLIAAATIAGTAIHTKSASITTEQRDVLGAILPDEQETSKVAALARIIATGAVLEEAEDEA